MADRTINHLDPEEANALGLFLVQMIALEEEVKTALAYLVGDDRAERVRAVFLKSMNFETMLKKLKPELDAVPRLDPKEWLKAVHRARLVRNAVAHQLPEMDYEIDVVNDQYDLYNVVTVTGSDVKMVRIRDLDQWASAASRLREELVGAVEEHRRRAVFEATDLF